MPDKLFGVQLIEALQRNGGMSCITSRLDYAQIQLLKQADRDEVIRRSGGSSFEFLQHLKRDSPEQLAEFLVGALGQAPQPYASALTGILLMTGL